MINSKREKLLSKIAKLQALASNAGTPDEAYAAAMKISALVDEYEVSEHELREANNAHQNHTEPEYTFANGFTADLHKVPLKWARILAVPVSQTFLCVTAFSRRGIYFYGTPENVELTLSFFDTMLQVLNRTTNKTYREASKRGQGKGWKTNYRQGFIHGFGAAIQEQQDQRTALTVNALAVQTDALAQYLHVFIDPKSKKVGSSPTLYNRQGYEQGYQEGNTHGQSR